MSNNYWSRKTLSRRRALQAMAAGSTGVAALSLIGCGDDDDSDGSGSGQSTQVLDSTKGKPGGKLVLQHQTVTGNLIFARTVDGFLNSAAGFSHSGLLEFRNGRPIVDTTDISMDPDLAQALPEQPDQLTYTYKLKDARFHNGRTVTSEDVKYSYERYAYGEQSAYKTLWAWLDKVETPDPKTVVVKTKAPFADAMLSMAARTDAYIFAKEHEEGPDADKKIVGTGPWTFVDQQPPLIMRFKKNPDYYDKPYPYFDEVEFLGTSDDAKRMADYLSGQVNVTYQFVEEQRDQIRRSRPDSVLWSILFGSHYLVLRTDQAPFTDKRVRQALSMGIDRKQIREAVSKGEGEDDQVLSYAAKAWGFRKPSELPGGKWWKYDPQAAKQLLSAAGITSPIEAPMLHRDANFLTQTFVDTATLTQSQWRTAGLANIQDVVITAANSTTTTGVGNYDGMFLSPNALANNIVVGNNLRNHFFSPPQGVTAPTQNTGHVNNPTLSGLVEKQLTQLKMEERQQTLRQVEETLAEEQYRLCFSSWGSFYFTDPTMRNVQIPKYAFSGSMGYAKYWWYDKA